MKHIKLLLILLICSINFGYGQIVAWEMNSNAGNEVTVNATTLDANLNTSVLSRGSGINPDALGNTFSSNNFSVGGTQANAITNDDFLQFQVSTASGYQVSLSTLDATLRRSNTAPNTYIWKYSIDGINFTNIGIPVTYNVNAGNGTAQTQINLSTIPALQNIQFGTIITLRLYAWGAGNVSGSFAFGRLAGNDLSLGGVVSVAPPCPTSVTWDGTAWSNGTGPTSASSAIIAGNYNTSIANPGFISCNLIVDATFTLTVDENYTIEVENDVVNNGNISVLTDGTFLQNNDSGTFTNSVNDNSVVTKETAIINNWYEYTYWSSPVQGEQIQDAFSQTNGDRRYWFNASNYQDSTMETANNNGTLNGQDDVDDNADDWQLAGATDVLLPGVGYAATLSTTSFVNAGVRYAHFFRGPFNNGIINVPIVRNDVETADTNWNFIGNPYPSAIDVDLFFAENVTSSGILDGALYLWSQSTTPADDNNGNSALNFDTSDYATINGTGEIAGGDNNDDGMIDAADIPNRFIPSGQGFFVSFSDGFATASGNVLFNNGMRVSGNNNQFFKTLNTQSFTSNNKLWLNLTSDNGIKSQILVGYVDGATAANDGAYYDATRNASTGMAAFVYSTIFGSDKKFSIQGKANTDLDLNEEIPLGIYTTIDVPTLYAISICKLEGAFLTSNTVYLEDSLMNTVHNLSNSDYTFTSAVGEFNDRFKIVFNTNTLSTDSFETNTNNLSIIELQNDNVKFSMASDDLTIKSVKIMDLLGRAIYNFRGSQNTEIYNLRNVSSSIYIAQVELSNGQIISKKAIKK